MFNKLGKEVDETLDSAFVAGTLSSGLEGPEDENIPTIESEQHYNRGQAESSIEESEKQTSQGNRAIQGAE